MSNILTPLEIRPVMELGISIEQIDEFVKTKGSSTNFRKTPDGWFIPLVYLEWIIDRTVKLVAADFLDSGEFYLVGGYEFWHRNEYLFGVETSTSFLFAREWGQAIQQLRNEGHARVWISSQSWFNLTLSGPLLEVEQIKLGAGIHSQFVFQFSEYCIQLDSAETQFQKFVDKFIPAIDRFLNKPGAISLIAKDLGVNLYDLR